MRVPTILGRTAETSGDKLAVVSTTHRLTFAEVASRSRELARWFDDHGIVRGDRVAVLSANTHELFELQLACQLTGCVYVPLNFRLSAEELAAIITDAGPQVLFVGHRQVDLAARVEHPVRRVGLDACERRPDLVPYPAGDGWGDRTDLPDVEADHPATLIYTSGTTAAAKGVLISNGALHTRLIINQHVVGMTESAVAVHPMPFFHVGAHLAFAYSLRGATNVVPEEFDPAELLRLLRDEEVTDAQLVPTMIERLCDELQEHGDVRELALRTIVYGGAPMTADRIAHAMKVLGARFVQMYGSTETGGISALRPAAHLDPTTRGSAGTPNVLTDVRITAPDGRECAEGEIGRLDVRGPSLLTRYWSEPNDRHEHSWFETGDLARLDGGYLTLAGRVSDVIITGGENVSARQVEDAILEHDGVRDACVIGLEDRDLGEIVAAVVAMTTDVGTSDLRASLADRLARYKMPRVIAVVDEVPRNALGKIDRRRARELATAEREAET